MKELYRAKRIDNGEYVEGNIIHKDNRCIIHSARPTNVVTKVCGFTGTWVCADPFNDEYEIDESTLEPITELTLGNPIRVMADISGDDVINLYLQKGTKQEMNTVKGLYKAKSIRDLGGSQPYSFNGGYIEGNLIYSNGKYYIHPISQRVQINDADLTNLFVMHEVDESTILEVSEPIIDKTVEDLIKAYIGE